MNIDRFIGAAANVTLLPFYRRRLERFEATLQRASLLQKKALFSKIQRCADTDFGRDHNFSQIKTVDDFRKQVPLSDYANVAPYIERVSGGEQGALFPKSEQVMAFSCTTGTTGRPKIIPVTQSWVREYRHSWEIWGVKALLDCPSVIGTRWLQIIGPAGVDKTETGLPIGMVSSVTARFQNPIIKSFYVGPTALADVEDPLSRYYTIMRLAMATKVGFITTITAANLIRLAEVGNDCREELIRDIHDGTLRNDINLPDQLRRELDRSIRVKRRDRARELESIIHRTGTLYPKDYWPMSLLACWRGGTVGYQSGRLPTFYGDVPVRELGYVSTEGRHTIPLTANSLSGVLAVDGSYYEFVPVECAGDPNPTVLEGCELRVNCNYNVYVTTSGGLYRHDLGDVVRCTGFMGEAPVLEFLHKSGEFSDMEGEKLSGYQVAHAVEKASARLGVSIKQFSAMPVRPRTGAPHYALLIEADSINDEHVAQQFLNGLDENLIEQNIMYRQKRGDHYLEGPRLRILAAGSWDSYASAAITRCGTGETQYKHPALLTERELPKGLKMVKEVLAADLT
jgi:hypothetical protein